MELQPQFTKYKANDKALFLIRKEWKRYKKSNIGIKTLSDLGKVLGVSSQIMTQYMNGHKQLSMEMVLRMASLFGCTPYDLDEQFPRWVEGTFYVPDED